MRDGIKLAANVYLPKGKGPWPVIVTRTPYLKDGRFWGAGASAVHRRRLRLRASRTCAAKAIARASTRPSSTTSPTATTRSKALAAEPWSNGQIGITGASAMGITSNLAAIAAPPHLKAAYVIVAPNETFTTSFLGGVPKEKDTVGWMKGQGISDEAIAAVHGRLDPQRLHRPRRAGRGAEICPHPDLERRRLVRHLQHRHGRQLRIPAEPRRQGRARQSAPDAWARSATARCRANLAYPGEDSLFAVSGRRHPLVRLLAEGRRQRRHGRAAGGLLHDGGGRKGRLFAEEPAHQGGQLADRLSRDPLLSDAGSRPGHGTRRTSRSPRPPIASIRPIPCRPSAART